MGDVNEEHIPEGRVKLIQKQVCFGSCCRKQIYPGYDENQEVGDKKAPVFFYDVEHNSAAAKLIQNRGDYNYQFTVSKAFFRCDKSLYLQPNFGEVAQLVRASDS